MLEKSYAGGFCSLLLVMAACGGGPTQPRSDGDEATGGSGWTEPWGTGGFPSGTGGNGAAGGGAGAARATGGAGAIDGSGGEPSGTGGDVTGTGGGATAACPTVEEETFSFFLTSREALVYFSSSEDGFGGDLGGLTGADALCQAIAETVSPCQSNKVWRAFLSTSTVNAIDRIGPGPWYDRVGRLFANNLQELLNDRPSNADPAIRDDFPNESGIPNHNPTATPGGEVDNHEILTGSGVDGRLYTQATDAGGGWFSGGSTACGDGEEWTVEKATCWDWTSSLPEGCPRVGHSWPAASGANWISVWNEGGCAPGGVLSDTASPGGGLDGTRRVGSAGGYGGFYCFALLDG